MIIMRRQKKKWVRSGNYKKLRDDKTDHFELWSEQKERKKNKVNWQVIVWLIIRIQVQLSTLAATLDWSKPFSIRPCTGTHVPVPLPVPVPQGIQSKKVSSVLLVAITRESRSFGRRSRHKSRKRSYKKIYKKKNLNNTKKKYRIQNTNCWYN